MRKTLWWGIRMGIALLLGAGMAALTGSIVFGVVVAGVVVLIVAAVAWEARANRGNAAYGRRSRDAGAAAHGGVYAGPFDAGGGSGDSCGGGGFGGFDGGGGFGGDGGGGAGC